MESISEEKLEQSLVELRQTFRIGKTRSASWRKAQLRGILKLIQEKEDQIYKALKKDLNKHHVEAYRDEVGVVKKSADYSLNYIEKWMTPKKGHIPLVFYPSSGEVVPEPFGLVLILVSWNFPISLALDPLIGAISAGNTVMIKPSELAPECSSFLAETIPLYLDSKAIKVIEGGSDVSQQLLQQKWDKIFFTGSQRVGRIVMSAAATHLTPVTLELGGKCPIIVDSLSTQSDIKVAAKRIVGGKFGSCGGQACIAIDYVLVEQNFASILLLKDQYMYMDNRAQKALALRGLGGSDVCNLSPVSREAISNGRIREVAIELEFLKRFIKSFYGDNIGNLTLARIVNKSHFERLRKLLEDPAIAASIVHGGSLDEENLIIEPTILLNPPLDSEIMTEEIFGPLLPIITLKNIEESIEFVNARPKPLSMYAFTKNEAFQKRIMMETSSGSLTFNDVLVQFLCDELPFGGVGQSGFGRYHGKYSFDTFSHEKAVLRRSFFLELDARYPPWNDFKFQFVRLAYNFNYVGLFLLLLFTKLKKLFRLNHSN